MNTALTLAAAFGLVLLNGFFVAAEFAFVKARSTRLEVLSREGDRRAQAALFGRDHLEAYLSVCQLGITLASLGLGWLGEPAVGALLRPLFELAGLASSPLASTLSLVIGFAVITFVHVVFGEQAPKTISIRAAESAVLHLAYPMRFCYYLFLPGVKILNSASALTVRLVGAGHLQTSEAHSTDELKILIAESKAGGQLDADEERFVNNIFNLDRRSARDIMIHRTRVDSLATTDTVGQAINLVLEKGHTRVPLYAGDKDNMVGFLHAKDLLNKMPDESLNSLARPALYIYDHLPIDEVLEHMRRENQQFGLVWDEYGSWQGLITMEDVIEAIVGALQDEFDHETPKVVPGPEGSFLVDSTVSPDELKDYLPLTLGPDAQEHYHTLAALLVEKFGEVPREGDSLELYGALFTIVTLDNHTISKIKVTPDPDPPTEPDADNSEPA